MYEVIRYFNLEKEIKALQRELKTKRYAFYDRSLNTRTTVINEEIVTVSFNVCDEIAGLIERTESIEQRIENLKLKQKYFNRFMNDLSDKERNYLINRYKHSDFRHDNVIADRKLKNEVKEIETAINYHNGIGEVEDIQEIKADSPMDRINKVLEVLEA